VRRTYRRAAPMATVSPGRGPGAACSRAVAALWCAAGRFWARLPTSLVLLACISSRKSVMHTMPKHSPAQRQDAEAMMKPSFCSWSSATVCGGHGMRGHETQGYAQLKTAAGWGMGPGGRGRGVLPWSPCGTTARTQRMEVPTPDGPQEILESPLLSLPLCKSRSHALVCECKRRRAAVFITSHKSPPPPFSSRMHAFGY
jgi:hypothetical protein